MKKIGLLIGTVGALATGTAFGGPPFGVELQKAEDSARLTPTPDSTVIAIGSVHRSRGARAGFLKFKVW